ncbi:hypothetical protein, variant [Exophiala oligosperma]|uniref:HTH La-type RNA-binding domain-containing protein n=1 Tax=Exophiala oligosperma TaxID=215243 RepID=A0A0D2BVX7_9EURO|nr:uncharacterized protein PV06_07130 [Exophiala oligosperma]XP_016261798.1 hypothetical protein, variant [Exophiala oligosperma]KIW41581.1 hypothetical protein PV06_07130 [Exophiala oligosperma]KIW41582.1 hypothetical protein, variant [Exophiala oligosperma]
MAEETVTDALQTAVDHNAAAAEDAKKLLAELQGDSEQKQETSETTIVEKPATDDSDKKEDDSRDREHRNDSAHYSRGGRGGRGDRRGGFTPRNYRNNSKFDPTSKEVTNDPAAIRKQVEFYFSDSNLHTDTFIRKSIKESENQSVDVKTIHNFKRMQRFQPFEAVVEALRDSTFVELTDEETRVRRKDLPEDWDDPNKITIQENAAMPRSVYVKGFGDEVASTQFDIEEFFEPYGPVKAVRLRRAQDKLFKGSVFVEFDTEETAKAFLALDPKPQYKGNDLQIMSKREYCEKKADDIKAGKIVPNKSRFQSGRRDNRDGRDYKRKKDGEDTRDWRTRRDEDKKRGFRDDKRRGDRGHKGGRSYEDKTDERGVPTVKSSAGPKDSGRDEALAKARAAVEEETKKEQGDQAIHQNGSAEETTSKKRAREEDGEAGPEPKKVDAKSEEVSAAAS